ncbi:hypothetical protein CPAR01_15450 [Colletotrichum paranaense]|uniref:Uncharacterized protein n=1 Tax=Colletotrichum paranaense TaxID=1914294 RepID=A0ABQ9RZ83_9PEZI|nr:uncharacterized protein CPAR01_15450 [Colletotrichum paranaense]KAK1519957.1 hypothetical protein CPAR01_15450 [Colletotrichum paranaense]
MQLCFVSKSEYGSPNDYSCLEYRRSGLECSSTPNLAQDGASVPESKCSFAPASTANAASFACVKPSTMGPWNAAARPSDLPWWAQEARKFT